MVLLAPCLGPGPGLAPAQRQGGCSLDSSNAQGTERPPDRSRSPGTSTPASAGASEGASGSCQAAVGAAAWRLVQAMRQLQASIVRLDNANSPALSLPPHMAASDSPAAAAAAAAAASDEGQASGLELPGGLEDLDPGQAGQLRAVLDELLLLPTPSPEMTGGGGSSSGGGQGVGLQGEEEKRGAAGDTDSDGQEGKQEGDCVNNHWEEGLRQPADEAEAWRAWCLWLSCGAPGGSSTGTAAPVAEGKRPQSPRAAPSSHACTNAGAAAAAAAPQATPDLPPLAAGPCGLLHPGYLPCGLLRRPHAHQLAWAAATWRLSGSFPYPAVTQQRPPLLKEAEGYHSAVAALEALLPELLPELLPVQAAEEEEEEEGKDERQRQDGVIEVEAAAEQQREPNGGLQATSAAASTSSITSTHRNGSSSYSSAGALRQRRALTRLLLQPQLLYVLLGFRLTAGSAVSRLVAPLPSAAECVAAFERRHAPPGNPSVLTVGARALTKHCHRDLRGEWWPSMSGSEAAKNQVARDMLSRLMRGAVWLNLHQLPPFDAPRFVLEMRNEQGYGARWAVDPSPTAAQQQRQPAEGQAAAAATPVTAAEAAAEGQAAAQSAVAAGEAPAPVPAAPCGAGAASTSDACEGMEAPAGAGTITVAAAACQVPLTAEQEASSTQPSTGSGALQRGTGGLPGKGAKGAGGGASMGATVDLPPPPPPQPQAVSFRGFLEPQMEGGHELGWRH